MRPRRFVHTRVRRACGGSVPGYAPVSSEATLSTSSLPAQASDKPTFADIGVRSEIVEALAEKGITHPFPIQAMSLPIAMAGTDMISVRRAPAPARRWLSALRCWNASPCRPTPVTRIWPSPASRKPS